MCGETFENFSKLYRVCEKSNRNADHLFDRRVRYFAYLIDSKGVHAFIHRTAVYLTLMVDILHIRILEGNATSFC